MGAFGSDTVIEVADIVLMDDKLQNLPVLLRIARKIWRIIFENIIFARGVKFMVLIFAAGGIVTIWLAMSADVGVEVIAILNAMRLIRA